MAGPQPAGYETELALAQAAESLGFSSYFRSDRYLPESGNSAPAPTDAWITLAGLARETSIIRLGTLVSQATFRLPAVLGVQIAQVDRMSGGRVELGIGAGQNQLEHRTYGIPFPPDRNARLEEQLHILHSLFRLRPGSTHSRTGTYYELVDCPSPQPAQAEVPLIISGLEVPRAPVLAADFANEFNAPNVSPAEAMAQFDYVRTVADYRPDLVYSVTVTACVGRTDAEVARRASLAGFALAELKAKGVAGTPGEVADTLARYAETGATRIYLELLDMSDLDHLELIAAKVRPQLV